MASSTITDRKVLHVNAISLGPEAALLQGEPTTGRVLAVLSGAVYLAGDEGHIVGLTNRDASDGSLTLRVADLAPILAALNGREGAPFRATGAALELDSSVRINWERARHWVPQVPSAVGTAVARLQSANVLAAEIASRGQEEGFGPLVACLPGIAAPVGAALAPPRSPMLQKANYYLTQLRETLAEWRIVEAAQALTSLLGLGPGLTPSGDDLVAGILAMMVWRTRLGGAYARATRRVAPTSALVEAIRVQAPQRTNRVSARLLWHAGEGVLYAPAMEVGAALLSGDPASIRTPAQHLFGIGATSGVDIAVGLLYGASVDL